jgi:hypothetical protein
LRADDLAVRRDFGAYADASADVFGGGRRKSAKKKT